jgi:RNA polymerase sigma-70 factor, ECF subfamily
MAGTTSVSLKRELVDAIPNMRAFAISLCGNPDRADDLVQAALVKAWSNLDTFKEGTNLKAWLLTILRNHYYSEFRKRRREVADPNGALSGQLACHPEQFGHMDMAELMEALKQLPDDQREALLLVSAEGFAYDEVAQICGCAVGTVKSRVNRARARLAEILQIESTHEFGPDRLNTAAIRSSITMINS